MQFGIALHLVQRSAELDSGGGREEGREIWIFLNSPSAGLSEGGEGWREARWQITTQYQGRLRQGVVLLLPPQILIKNEQIQTVFK